MKHALLTFLVLTTFVSCGSKSTDSTSSEDLTSRQLSTLTPEEIALQDRLLMKGIINQKDLYFELAGFDSLSTETITKLDRALKVECSRADGLCRISPKE